MAKPSPFDDIELVWRGTTYVIPATRVMGAIARIENVVTLPELSEMASRGTVPFGKIAMAYASVLRYAGAVVSDMEMYQSIFPSEKDQQNAIFAVNALMAMMVPPEVKEETEKKIARGEDTEEGVQDRDPRPTRAQRRAAASSSKKRTKRHASGA